MTGATLLNLLYLLFFLSLASLEVPLLNIVPCNLKMALVKY